MPQSPQRLVQSSTFRYYSPVMGLCIPSVAANRARLASQLRYCGADRGSQAFSHRFLGGCPRCGFGRSSCSASRRTASGRSIDEVCSALAVAALRQSRSRWTGGCTPTGRNLPGPYADSGSTGCTGNRSRPWSSVPSARTSIVHVASRQSRLRDPLGSECLTSATGLDARASGCRVHLVNRTTTRLAPQNPGVTRVPERAGVFLPQKGEGAPVAIGTNGCHSG